jgi:hypothetical protein
VIYPFYEIIELLIVKSTKIKINPLN